MITIVEYKGKLPEGFSGVVKVKKPTHVQFLEVQEKLSSFGVTEDKKDMRNAVKAMEFLLDWARPFVEELNIKHEDGSELSDYQQALDDGDGRDFCMELSRDLASGLKRQKKSQMETKL